MNPPTSDADRPFLEIRSARAASVIVQRIPAECADVFMEWQRGITAAAGVFPGYQRTEIYPPWRQQTEWVVIIHFDDQNALQDWLDSPMRAEWIAKLPCEVRDYRLKMLPSGFGAWVAGLSEDGERLPHWKLALTVLLGLYPIVMLLTIYLYPHIEHFGVAVAFLISNACSVSILEWLGMPVINRVLGTWLHANGKDGRKLSLIGLILILGALALMTFLFRLVT